MISILENGVSQYPELKGQFPQVSGVKFSFDPLCEPHNRVLKDSILIKNEPLDETKVTTRDSLIDRNVYSDEAVQTSDSYFDLRINLLEVGCLCLNE